MPPGPQFTLRRIIIAGAAGLLAVFYLVLALTTAGGKSAHFDETAHIASGYHALHYGDYRVVTSNMILGQKLAALPLINADIRPPDENVRQQLLARAGSASYGVGYTLLYQSGNDPQRILVRGRLMMVMLGLLTAACVFFWSRRLFGGEGGLVSLLFLATCPTFLSLSGIIGADMPAACLFLPTMWSYWTLLHKVTPFTLGAFGTTAGLLLLAKMSSLTFGPIALVLLAVRLWVGGEMRVGYGWKAPHRVIGRVQQGTLLAAAAMASTLIVAGVIWSGYGFRYAAAPADAPGAVLNWHQFDGQNTTLLRFVSAARNGQWLPEAFLFDLATLTKLTAVRLAYLMGAVSLNGWMFYFPFTFLAKSSWALIAAIVASVAIWIHSTRRTGRTGSPWSLYDCAPLLCFITLFMGFSMMQNLNIGHRHIFPIYPFIFVLLGGLGAVFKKHVLWLKVVVGTIMTGAIVSAASAHPNHLAYISPLLGGPNNAYRLLVDSSLEWGQELPAVKRWQDAHAPELEDGTHGYYFSYFGTGDPESYGITARRLHSFFDWREPIHERLLPGVYLLSATMLEPVYCVFRNMPSFVGPWNKVYEREYQTRHRHAQAFFAAQERARAADDDSLLLTWMCENLPANVAESDAANFWAYQLSAYDFIRFCRLTCFLRHREPDENINYSVYVFRLNAMELRQALEGSPPELLEEPVIKGSSRR
jgi:hypothetical protein